MPLLHAENSANPAHVWVNLLPVDCHKRKQTICREEQFLNICDAELVGFFGLRSCRFLRADSANRA